MEFYKLKISDINKETENAVSITLEVPENLKPSFVFKAGQYITLKTEINGVDVRRDYSLCTNPNSDVLQVVVKEVENGMFSKYANNQLRIGDTLEVASPRGRFTFEPQNSQSKNIVAFAAGSGITPIKSIVNTVLEEESDSKFILIYGNKTPKDTIFYDKLKRMLDHYKGRLQIKFVFSQTNEPNALFGRIERSTVSYIVKHIIKGQNIDAFYLCGPEDMINIVSNSLKEYDFDEDIIKHELFTSKQNILEVDADISNDGNTTVTVMVDDEETTFVMPQSKTILEAALENDIDAPYSCQGGICSSCIARLITGKATMRQNNILTDSELEEGLILTCQAQPTTSSIHIDYDDV